MKTELIIHNSWFGQFTPENAQAIRDEVKRRFSNQRLIIVIDNPYRSNLEFYADQSLMATDLYNQDGEATLSLALTSIRQFFTSTENFHVKFESGKVRFISLQAGKAGFPYRVYLQIQE